MRRRQLQKNLYEKKEKTPEMKLFSNYWRINLIGENKKFYNWIRSEGGHIRVRNL